jgi:hypothetical protein
VGLVAYIQAALTLVLAVVVILVFAAIRSVRGDVRKLLGAFRKGHGEDEPCPTGSAVVTPSPSPAPVQIGEPAPMPEGASARSALLLPSAAPASGVTSSSVAAMRARYEAEADERDARDAEADDQRRTVEAPRVEVDDERRITEDEFTHVLVRNPKAPLHKLPVRGTLVGVAPERIVSSPRRAAEDFQRRQGDRITPTQPSAPAVPIPVVADVGVPALARVDALARERGVSREAMAAELARTGMGEPSNDAPPDERGTPSVPPPPSRPRFDGRVAMRYRELVAAAQLNGKNARHCLSAKCCGNEGGIAECACECRDGCGLLADLWKRAEREAGKH